MVKSQPVSVSPVVGDVTALKGEGLIKALTESLKEITDYQLLKGRTNIYAQWKPANSPSRFEITGITWQQVMTVCDGALQNAAVVEASRSALVKTASEVATLQKSIAAYNEILNAYKHSSFWGRLRFLFTNSTKSL